MLVQAPVQSRSSLRAAALTACALLLAVHALLAWTTVIRQSATYDEPLHAVAAHVVRHHRDFRVNPEDPPLWQYWADLPHPKEQLKPDLDSPLFTAQLTDPTYHWRFVLEGLYLRSGIDADSYLNQSRAMMLPISLLLGAAIAALAWRLAGPIAAVAACALYALDPNFIGHAPLIKNDVVFSLAVLAAAAALWALGRKATVWRALGLALACGVGLTVKFSGVLLVPMIVIVLIVRALLPRPWQVGRTTVQRITSKLAVSAALLLATGIASYAMIWACYGFRFSGTPNQLLDIDPLLEQVAWNRVWPKHPGIDPTHEEVQAARQHPGLVVGAIQTAHQHKLLPQAWLAGFLYTYMSSLLRGSYLLGQNSALGWWYYFPLAMLFKTPLATVAAIGAAAWLFLRRRAQDLWTLCALGIPAALYAAAALTTNLNLGLRHVFPLYPPLFVMAGVAAARAPLRLIAVLGLGLAIETLAAYPNYIAFFNAPSQAYGPVKLLGDSNLDWGQNLPQLAQWQKEHPDKKLYLCYFGSPPPRYYGLSYIALPGGYQFEDPAKDFPPEPGVIAISASNLQGIYMNGQLRAMYRPLMRMQPIQVLGGSIFLYETP